MNTSVCTWLLVGCAAVLGRVQCQFDVDNSLAGADYDLQQMYARDQEQNPGPLAFGGKFMTGGAGEGSQLLEPSGQFQFRQNVKSDSVLPAYCNPPNPCPKGHTPEKDGCITEFENTAQFSKSYQESQDCLCDEEHMRSCPQKENQAQQPETPESLEAAIDAYLTEKEMERHAETVAKKGDKQMDPLVEHYPRK